MIVLVLPGPPRGKHAPKHVQGRTILDRKDAEAIVRWQRCWQDEGAEFVDGPVEVRILVECERPQGHWRKRLDEHGRRQLSADGLRAPIPPLPDVDNVAKLVLDALKRLAFQDDRHIARLEVVKVWAPKAQTTVGVYEWQTEARASAGFRVAVGAR